MSRRPSTPRSSRISTICQAGSSPTVVPSSGMGPAPSVNSADSNIITSSA
ncbi:Uncharacterised protein [Mycobacterium tuberculosis]|uniref:Uncharacterized protein n=1 Tax=Mycobacterium tuberculosis TaxID=1773 RepID=A0A916LEQ1_MYCTX|nr:Uncharacterised protein [Mycobacterium tuberculosis]COY26508.1 Uncharacterised protein [Mycobacterium tuberculosis]CPA11366.1 Uncharacterised protein [Mycobacterium tuberculosis]